MRLRSEPPVDAGERRSRRWMGSRRRSRHRRRSSTGLYGRSTRRNGATTIITARRTVAIAFALAAVVAGTAARADELSDLERTAGDLPELQQLVALHAELDHLLARYHRLEVRVGRARLRTVRAIRGAETAQGAVEDAEERLDERVRTAYQLGAGAPIEAILGASSLGDLATYAEYAARAIEVDAADLRDRVLAQAVASARWAQAEAERAALDPQVDHLRSLLEEMQLAIDEATELAVRAHLEDEARRAFEEQQRQIAAALSRTGSWDLGVIDYQQDQSQLLSLLGPTGGRTCDTPPGLVATGEGFSGYATYYAWEFAGNPTATGAIFDPTLFTAANRWLPFGTFLRVRNGDRCAIVLVNDRGPYGHLERVIDLSMAAGQYLGVGVTWVDAEILIPEDVLPG